MVCEAIYKTTHIATDTHTQINAQRVRQLIVAYLGTRNLHEICMIEIY